MAGEGKELAGGEEMRSFDEMEAISVRNKLKLKRLAR